jgi:spore maturation protein B
VLVQAVAFLSRLAIPLLLLLLMAAGVRKRLRLYELFVEGAKEGFDTAVQILPYLLAMFVALGILRESGAFDAVLGLVGPLTEAIGVPREVLPLALLRPLSGSGALGAMSELFASHGPDSQIGLMASVIQGSTETTFYVLTVYFGSVGVKKVRHALAVGVWADVFAFLLAVYAVQLMF